MKKLAEIKEMLGKISPWSWQDGDYKDEVFSADNQTVCGTGDDHGYCGGVHHESDCIFIFQSPQLVSELVERIEKLGKALKFYANEGAWCFSQNNFEEKDRDFYLKIESYDMIKGEKGYVGGRLARTTLEEIG